MLLILGEYLSYVEMDAYVKGELIIICHMLRNSSKDLEFVQRFVIIKMKRLLSPKPFVFKL